MTHQTLKSRSAVRQSTGGDEYQIVGMGVAVVLAFNTERVLICAPVDAGIVHVQRFRLYQLQL
jgi:hypothetical protein